MRIHYRGWVFNIILVDVKVKLEKLDEDEEAGGTEEGQNDPDTGQEGGESMSPGHTGTVINKSHAKDGCRLRAI